MRPLYRRSDLERALAPRSIAIVGASERPGSLGLRTAKNLERYAGRVHYVNAQYTALLGKPCHASLAALPEVPDCAVLAIPKAGVEAAVAECARLGVGAAVLFAGGYAETGTDEGRQAQQRLIDIAAPAGLRLVGPNSTGLANFVTGAHAAFAEFAPSTPRASGTVGLITQSGALGLAVSAAANTGTTFSHVLTCGNSCDVDVADYVAWLAEEPSCQSIACVFEGLREPAHLVEAAKLARENGKPLVVAMLGESEAGRVAARLHTATAVEERGALKKALESAGACLVPFAHLVETASFFAKAPSPATPAGVAVLTSTGGGAILVADALEASGVPLPQPGAEAMRTLEQAVPAYGARRNPCDMTANATSNHAMVDACARALLADPAYSALVLPVSRAINVPMFQALGEEARRLGKTVCVVWLSGWLDGPGTKDFEADPNLALFRSPQACARAIGTWLNRSTGERKP
jgi:acetyl-CoA synthetase